MTDDRVTVHLDNSQSHFDADMAAFKAAHIYQPARHCRITVQVPANHWEGVKDRLRRLPGLRWLKVRTKPEVRFVGAVVPWTYPTS